MEEEQDIQSDIVKQKQLRDAQENQEFDREMGAYRRGQKNLTDEERLERMKDITAKRKQLKDNLLSAITTTTNFATDSIEDAKKFEDIRNPLNWGSNIGALGIRAIDSAIPRTPRELMMETAQLVTSGPTGYSAMKLAKEIPMVASGIDKFDKATTAFRTNLKNRILAAIRGDQILPDGTIVKKGSQPLMSKGSDAIDDGYIEEIVEQGDNVIYPPGSKEADILANTKAMASDTYHLADFDDTEIFFTTPDPKSFKKSDVISWDKSKILRQEQKLKANEAAREQAYQVALRQAGGDRSKISRKVYEQYAGATNISEVEKVAKRTGHNIGHVIKYMEHNEYQLRQLNSARTLLNDWARRNTVDTMRATLAKYANDRKIVNSNEYKNYVKLAKSLDNATSGIWTKGHKDAIKAVFMRGEFGGNRISNLMLEEGIDSIFRDATTGKLRTIKGNIAKQDRPVDKYTLVNLAGTSWDLTDDFLKVVNPRSVLVDMNEGLKKFGDQYTDIALNAYDKLITEFLQANSIKLNSRKAKTASRAITDGLVAWFEKFDEMQLSGKVKDLKSKLQLPIDIDNAKDYWFRNENTIGKRTQKTRLDPDKSYEIDLLENEFIKAFKRIWDNTK